MASPKNSNPIHNERGEKPIEKITTAQFRLTNEQFDARQNLLLDLRRSAPGPTPADQTPTHFTLSGATYHCVPGEERFLPPGVTPLDQSSSPVDLSVTALAVMKAVLPNTTRSLYRRLTPPDDIYILGDSSRRKIIRAFQLWHERPLTTPETDQFVPFFQYLSNDVEDRWEISQQWASVQWATQYADNELAASLLLHYGWTPDFRVPMVNPSQHKLTIVSDGVIVDIEYHHTFQERLDAACVAMETFIANRKRLAQPLLLGEIIAEGMKKFYYHRQRYISIHKEYRMSVTNKLTSFAEQCINALREEDFPPRPLIDEPEDVIEEQQLYIKFSEFELQERASKPQVDQRTVNNNSRATDQLALHLPKLKPDIVYRRKDLIEMGFNDRHLASGVKLGYLTKIKAGQYKLLKGAD